LAKGSWVYSTRPTLGYQEIKRGGKEMPATSEDMRKKFCIALSIKRGETPRSYSPEAAEMADSMTEEQLRDYCKSPVKK